MKERLVSDFYKSDGINFASYDNIRKLPNYIDGLKISQRKLLWAGFDKAFNDFHKTEPFCNITATTTAYIHGPQNLIGIVSLMAAQYCTSNNYPLFIGNDSGFGSRINPAYASGRYTKVKVSNVAKILFNKSDTNILEKQFFEGQYIEPKFLVPVFPTIFLNPSEGLSTGFASAICPRNPTEIIEYIKKKINGVEKPRMALLPWFKNHLGKVEYNKELDRNESFGIITKNNMTSYTITELPINVDYQKYIEFLDKLIDNGTIQDYDDKCDPKTDAILFEIKTTRDFTRNHENERDLYEAFHLIKSLPETLCLIDENNHVREFSSIYEILDSFIKIRLDFYDKRKTHLLNSLKEKLIILASKYWFVKGIVDDTIIVNKRTKTDIVKQLERIDKIKKVNDSYDYLLAMQIQSLSKEKLDELKKQIDDGKAEYKKIKETSINDMWLNDLNEFKKLI